MYTSMIRFGNVRPQNMEVPHASKYSSKWRRALFFHGSWLGLNDLDYLSVWNLEWWKHPVIENLWYTFKKKFKEKNTSKGLSAHVLVIFSRLNGEEFWGPYKWGKIYKDEMVKAAYQNTKARALMRLGVSFTPKGYYNPKSGWQDFVELSAVSRAGNQRRLCRWLRKNSNWQGKTLAPYLESPPPPGPLVPPPVGPALKRGDIS